VVCGTLRANTPPGILLQMALEGKPEAVISIQMGASTVFSLPLIVLFFFAMKTSIRRAAMTGIKG
jgi:ABC-type glycerol-3-phosphate transport system permease component